VVAEPPLCTTCSVVFALREAIKANIAEKEESKTDEWIRIGKYFAHHFRNKLLTEPLILVQ
jgi:hypothetical protein